MVAILAPEGKVKYMFPMEHTAPPGFRYPETYKAAEFSGVATIYGEHRQQGFIYIRWLFRMVMEGKFAAHPHEVMPGGLAGVSQAPDKIEGHVLTMQIALRALQCKYSWSVRWNI